MCHTRNSRYVEVKGRRFRVDGCMANMITHLAKMADETGVDTLACCCGHGRYPATIVIKGRKTGRIYDMLSRRTIPRTRNFYKTDKDGYYYLPEVQEHYA